MYTSVGKLPVHDEILNKNACGNFASLFSIYKTLIRPNLEYCIQLWNPVHEHRNWSIILRIKGVQRRFTRMINGIALLPYSERLEILGLTTLAERHARGDLIEVYKAKHDFSLIMFSNLVDQDWIFCQSFVQVPMQNVIPLKEIVWTRESENIGTNYLMI